MKKLLPFAILIFVAASFGVVASCKQGEGERCQLQSDCQSGLTCNVAQHVCVSSGSGSDIDALPPEAGPIDAPTDTPSDAIDAATD